MDASAREEEEEWRGVIKNTQQKVLLYAGFREGHEREKGSRDEGIG